MQVYHRPTPTRTNRRAPKPIGTAREAAMRDELTSLEDESGAIYDQLFDAIKYGKETTAHHAVDRMLDMRMRYEAVQADLQAMAGEGSQERRVAA